MADLNALELSDEEFAKLNGPPEETPVAAAAVPDPADTPAVAGEETDNTSADAETDDDLTDAERAAAANDGEDPDEGGDTKPEDKLEGEAPADPAKAGEDKPAEAAADGKPAVEKPQESADKLGEDKAAVGQPRVFQVPTSFKANGKTIELKDEAEALSLMQMGANYTRKMQDIQPHRKVLMMLQNNDLLDEGKLSFLIDLDKKDPAAIKQLIKDSGIDPLEIDTSENSGYLAGNHQVSDTEANFRAMMDEVTSTPHGKETVAEIHSTWDETSKEALWSSPQIMATIHEQRESGVYATITAEMDRQRILGKIPVTMPFLEAYKTVGDQLVAAAEGQGSAPGSAPAGEKTPQVIASRVAAPKSSLANGDKASAASPTKASPKAAKVLVNPLAESDEEFLKQMNNRV